MKNCLKQTFCDSPEDCQWLRETHLKDKNLNNGPVPPFKSFVMFGNEDCPQSILLYGEKSPNINDKPIRFDLMDNGNYSTY